MGAANVRTPERDSLDLSKELAYAYGGTYHYIYAPLFVNSEEVRDSLEQEPNIKGCLELAKNADIILTSVGSIVYKSWKSYLSTRDLYNLEKKGAIGHIGGHFYDIDVYKRQWFLLWSTWTVLSNRRTIDIPLTSNDHRRIRTTVL